MAEKFDQKCLARMTIEQMLQAIVINEAGHQLHGDGLCSRAALWIAVNAIR